MRYWISLTIILASLALVPARADDWQRLAEQIPYVNYGDFLYNRPPRNLSDADSPTLTAIQSAMAIQADLSELKKRVEHADPKVRALALMKLYISGDPNAFRVIHSRLADEAMIVPKEDTVLGTRDELIEKGKALGPDALLAFLRDGSRAGLKHPKVDDLNKGTRFILRHAKHFFRKQDAETLREMGHYIAAADIRPEMASVWIREACAKWSESYQGWDRARAMAALLDLKGDKELKFAVDWFYATEPISSGTSDHTVFITEYQRRRPADWKTTMSTLVAHPDFDTVDSMTLLYIALMINDLNGEVLIDQPLLQDERKTELRNAIRHSLGLAEKPVKWINLNDEGERLDPEWTAPFDETATHMVMSPDSTLLAIVTRDGKIRIHRASDGVFLGEIPTDKAGVSTIEFRRNGGRLMVARVTGGIEFWDARELRLVEETKIQGLGATEACLDTGGAWLASRMANNVGVSVYDVQTGKQRWNVPMGVRAFGMIGASLDGSRFAVCNGFVRTVLLFDPAKAEPVARLNGHSGIPQQVAFSTDGATMVTSGDDTKILVWNAKTGERVSEFASRQQYPRVLACSGNSTSYFFGGGVGKITRVELNERRVIQSLKFDGTWPQVMARSNKFVAAVVNTKNSKFSLVGWRLAE